MDTRTLSFTLALVGTAIALCLVVFAGFRRERGLVIIASGFLSAVAAFSLFIGQGSLPDWISFILANMLIVFYQLSLAWGIRDCFGVIPAWPRRFGAYLSIWLVTLVVALGASGSFTFRAVSSSLFIILASLEFLVVLHRIAGDVSMLVRRVAWAMAVAFIGCHALRMALLLAQSSGQDRLMGNDFVNIYSFSFSLFFSVLWAGLILTIDAAHVLAQLDRKNKTLEGMATSDQLTGLRNRRSLEAKLGSEMERTARYQEALSVILFDIDFFKNVNDTWGHQAGDQVLKRVADLTRAHVRQPDDLFRWGGEEFLLVAPHTPLEGAVSLAEKLRATVASESFGEVGTVTASFGVAEWKSGESREDWFKRVDQALYRAKNTGRNRVVAFSSQDALPLAQARIEWKAEWESGNAFIDDEHRRLLELSNNLLDVSLSGGSAPRLIEAVDLLLNHVSSHFSHEETILAEVGYPDRDAHARLHADLVQAALALKTSVEAGSGDVGALFNFLVYQIVVGHIAKEDVKFFEYTRQA